MPDGNKRLSVSELRGLLVDLPDHFLLEVNRVGNLLVSHKQRYVGYIDFHEGVFIVPLKDEEDGD